MTTDQNPARQTSNRNANQRYNDLKETLQERLEDLESATAEHERSQTGDAGNWGYAGDLEHALGLLDRALSALGDTSAQEREERSASYRYGY